MIRSGQIIAPLVVILLFNGLMITLALTPDISFGAVNSDNLSKIELKNRNIFSSRFYKNEMYLISYQNNEDERSFDFGKIGRSGEFLRLGSIDGHSNPRIEGMRKGIVYLSDIGFYSNLSYSKILLYTTGGKKLEPILIPFDEYSGNEEELEVLFHRTYDVGIYKKMLFVAQGYSYRLQNSNEPTHFNVIKAYNLAEQKLLGTVFQTNISIQILPEDDNQGHMLVGSNSPPTYRYELYQANGNGNWTQIDTFSFEVPKYHGISLSSYRSILFYNYTNFKNPDESTVEILEAFSGSKIAFHFPIWIGSLNLVKEKNHMIMYGSLYNSTLETYVPMLIDIRKKGSFVDSSFIHDKLNLHNLSSYTRGSVNRVIVQGSNLAIFVSYVKGQQTLAAIYFSPKGFFPGVFSTEVSPILQFNSYAMAAAVVVVIIQYVRRKRPEEPEKLDYPEYG